MSDREELIKIIIFLVGVLVGAYVLSGPLTMALQLFLLVPSVAFVMALVLALNPLVWAICLLVYVLKRI